MSVNLTINGQTFAYPEVEDTDWGTSATLWATAVTNGMLQKAGGTFTLLADVDFGATYGLVSGYYKTRTANLSTAGSLRLAQADSIGWRNNANSANLLLSVSSDVLQFNGTPIIISGLIVNADIAAAAAIAFSKLAALTSGNILVGSAGNVATSVAMSGDITITNAGVTAIGSGVIVNDDINASAAIAYSKLNLATSIVNADVSASAAIVFSKLSGVVGTTTNQTVAGIKTFTDNVLIDNEKELRLLEATAGGTNYMGFKAPAALTGSTTFTLPNGDGSANQVLQTSGGGTLSWATVAAGIGTNFGTHTVTNADYTILDADGYRYILVSTGNTARVITLPAVATNTDRAITVKKIDSGTGSVTVTRAGSATIDGATTYVLTAQYEKVTVECDGTNWYILEGVEGTTTRKGILALPGRAVTTISSGNQSVTSASFQNITNFSLDITLVRTSRILFSFMTSFRNSAAAGTATEFNVDINSVQQFGTTGGIYTQTDTANYFRGICITGLSQELAPGTYTARLQARSSTGTVTVLADTNNVSMISLIEI